MTGPSATGSENGIPSSKVSTPASAKAKAASTVNSKEGKPVVIYATKFFNGTLFIYIVSTLYDKMSKNIDGTLKTDEYSFDLMMKMPHEHVTDVVDLNSQFFNDFIEEEFDEEEQILFINVLLFTLGINLTEGISAGQILSVYKKEPTKSIYAIYTVLIERDKQTG